MPKDYSNGKIYQMEPICDHEEGDVYIGSTIQKGISHRFAEHIYNYKKWKNGKYSFTSSFSLFEKYGIDNMRIILLETYSCNSNDELRARETHYQKQNKCINNRMAFINKEELLEYKKKYRIEHREEMLEYQKEYYQNKKQEISKKKKEIITCECGREVRNNELKRHQHRDIHKELMLQLTKEK